ncbi:DUF397 domain-containing protein [Streptosporangium carneum]|uniref:DUF397 domain-containing protein n=1 Tax=Streptosporangium carneum TaxID=47481 RepID=A0A9W6I248_9ACTN|nr:DUF397 domain-containing protein [Streptosporangium carneum]GLK09604.1 hypothetical protein GCM10017600_30100 [Streptosporangium carneum]
MDELIREVDTATWRKSTLSGSDGGDCVEVATLTGGHRGVRDSKDTSDPALILTPAGWNAFVEVIRNGAFG